MPDEDFFERTRKKWKKKKLTRKDAIRLYCREQCCAGDLKSWKECTFYNCFLFQFRLGRQRLERGKSFKKQHKTGVNFNKKSLSGLDKQSKLIFMAKPEETKE